MASDDTELRHWRSHEHARLDILTRRYQALLKDDTASNRFEYETAATNYVNAWMRRKSRDNERKVKQQATDT